MEWTHVLRVTVPAKPAGLWTVAVEYLESWQRLRITAEGSWDVGGVTSGPDGSRISAIDRARCLVDKAPAGALIGKLGGSTAGMSDGHLFVVGSSCVLQPTDDTPKSGPLYLTINDTVEGFEDNAGSIEVCIQDGYVLGEPQA
jgi:hypothetical protein